jgi:hypothetical protein
MASVSSEINAMIKSLEAMGGMVEACGPELVAVVRASLERSIAAGADPYGDKWKPTLEGKIPLRNAAKAISVSAIGKTIYVVIEGVEAMHHLGSARGKIRRRVIPSKKRIPDPMMLGIKQVLDRYFENQVKHAG